MAARVGEVWARGREYMSSCVSDSCRGGVANLCTWMGGGGWIEGGCFGVIVIVVFGGEECIGGADNFEWRTRYPARLPMQLSRAVGDGGGRPWW